MPEAPRAETAPNTEALAAALAAVPGFADARADTLAPLPVRGLQHRLYRIAGRGALLRVPRESHWGMAPAAALDYQAAAFRRASPSGAVPALLAVLRPSAALPWGSLVVEEILGAVPDLPRDLPALAHALAAVHLLELPPTAARAPLMDQDDPVAETVAVIERQANALDAAGVSPAAQAAIADERAWARGFARECAGHAQPTALVLTDTQPGNFVVRPDGRAIAVDLEKSLYGSPAIDLAHATLHPSARWDRAVVHAPDLAETADFYRRYLAGVGPGQAAALRPWLAPLRRLTWLRTVTIFATMKAAWRRGTWSGLALEPEALAHALRHFDDCHDPARIAAVRAEWLDGPGIAVLL